MATKFLHQLRAVTLLQICEKCQLNNPNIDLVSIYSYIKFGQNLPICIQDIERKQNFGVNQGL